MTDYQPTEQLSIDGNASDLDDRANDVLQADVIGATTSVSGRVSHIVVDGELSSDDLDALESEFGVAWCAADRS